MRDILKFCLSAYVLVAAGVLASSPVPLKAESVRCGTCYDTHESCAAGPHTCGGNGTIYRCTSPHGCCSSGEVYGHCTSGEEQ